jgi:hypothetical protein
MPWLHGHQIKAMALIVEAILEHQTGVQAGLVRSMGNQEASLKQLSRLIHNERLDPRKLANGILEQALLHLPKKGRVRIALDWTIEDDQHLLVVSLLIKGRAVPVFWRAYQASVLKGRMKRYEAAIIKRCVNRVRKTIGKRRLILTADRGFADVDLCDVLENMDIEYVIRVKATTKIHLGGRWISLGDVPFVTNARHRSLGLVRYCASNPRKLWVGKTRALDQHGKWQEWHLISNRRGSSRQLAAEYARRFGCEEGFRDAKRLLGFAEARVKDIEAWSRFFALFALALLILTVLVVTVLLGDPEKAAQLLRLITSRRRSRPELSLVNTMLKLLKLEYSLFDSLSPHTIFPISFVSA